MNFTYEAPFTDPGKSTPIKKVKEKKKRKKKIRVSKYEIDVNNLFSKDFRDKKTYWNLDVFPVDRMGEFITHSRTEFVGLVQEKIRTLYKESKRLSGKVEYPHIVNAVLDGIGCHDFWSRGKIRSELSKKIQARRKEKKMLEQKRKLEEARQAELSLGVLEKD